VLRGVGLALAVLALAGCGGGAKKAACPAVQKLDRELTAMRAAQTPAEASRLTDRFLQDVDTAPIDNLARNRMIDHAAAAVSALCPQCFQALEADRPIPAIAHGDVGAGCSDAGS
jgi:hypothetical protein